MLLLAIMPLLLPDYNGRPANVQVCENLNKKNYRLRISIYFLFTIVVGMTYSVLTGLPPRVIVMSDVTSEVMVDTLVRVKVV